MGSDQRFDHRAGRQIFSREFTRKDGRVATIAKDTENPIDIRLRQMALASLDGRLDLKSEFLEKWAVAMVGEIDNLRLIKGRIKDLYLSTRDIRIKTRKGDDVITSFDKVVSVSEREP
jgi:hypothetical protein